jgi:hypothetical protein
VKNGLSSPSSSVNISNVKASKSTDAVAMVNQTEDDLRAGTFEFVTETSEIINFHFFAW